MEEKNNKMLTEEQIVKKFKLLSIASMVLGLMTATFATQILLSGWSIWPALICGVPALILNGMAKTYQEMLRDKPKYGDPTEK